MVATSLCLSKSWDSTNVLAVFQQMRGKTVPRRGRVKPDTRAANASGYGRMAWAKGRQNRWKTKRSQTLREGLEERANEVLKTKPISSGTGQHDE